MTFAVTDVESSTQLFRRLGERYPKLLERAMTRITAAVTEHRGAVFKNTGDGVLAAFEDPLEAVRACVDAQRALAADASPPGDELRVRIGLHLGNAQPTAEGDYVAMTLHEATRVADAAHGGQVLVSDAVAEAVRIRSSDDVKLRDLGEYEVRDFEGEQALFQVVALGLREVFPALRVARRRRHNLPLPPTELLGREQELRAIRRAVAANAVVTLLGPGGVGKTRLAMGAALEQLDDFQDGVRLVELAPLRDDNAVAEAVADVVGVRAPATESSLSETIVKHLADRRALLVLDNCEQVRNGVAFLAAAIARSCAGMRILATSRAPLAIEAEKRVSITPLKGQTPVRLFMSRASAALSGFDPAPDDVEAIRELCQRLDGIPLAIELAAALTPALKPREIATRVPMGLQLATGGGGDRDPRHRTLEATIAWSYDLLSARSREAFEWLSVFPASFSFAAADRMLGSDTAVHALPELVDHSIITVADADSERRYRMLETVSEFGRRRLDRSGHGPTPKERFIEWALELVAAAGRGVLTPGRRDWLARISREHENLLEAIRLARDPQQRIRLVAGLAELRGRGWNVSETRRLLEEALADAPDPRAAEAVRARIAYGVILRVRGRLDDSRRELIAAAGDAQARGDRTLSASARAEAGITALIQGALDDGNRLLEEALDAAPTERVRLRVLLFTSEEDWVDGRLDRVRAALERCLAEARLAGVEELVVQAAASLAELAVDMGDYEAAERAAQEVLELAEPNTDLHEMNMAESSLGASALETGRLEEADAWIREAASADLRRESTGAASGLEMLSLARAMLGAHREAAVLLGAASQIRDAAGWERDRMDTIRFERTNVLLSRSLDQLELDRLEAAGRDLNRRQLLVLVEAQASEGVGTGSAPR